MLSGKVILIMGGTAGLGKSAALACVAAGAKVIAVGRDPEKVQQMAEQLGADGLALQGDARESKTSEDAVVQAIEKFGRLDALYHVAGGSGRRMGDGPLDQIPDAGWSETIDLNLSAVFYSNRAVTRHLLKQGSGGAILNMSSVLGYSPSPALFSTHAYAAAKSGVVGFTKSAAAYYAPKNIRFNVIAPSLIATPMSTRAQQDEKVMDFIKTKQPLDGGRIGEPADLDAAVVYFLSDASRFVTGQILAVDGGWSVSEGQL